MNIPIGLILLVLLASAFAGAPGCEPEPMASSPSAETLRTVAVTIDDLPTVRGETAERRQRITDGLLAHLAAHRIPAIGFVNEQKMGEPAPHPDQVAMLERWLDAGLELGNHTYSHPSLFETPLADFQDDVLRGERVTRRLMAQRGDTLRYFRHPYLNTGPDTTTKAAFEQFLAAHGYTIAPVTFDNDEWIYALAYDRAEAAGDSALARRVGEDYVRYMDETFAFYEAFSRDLLGREPAQILLIHANALNADYLGALADALERRGYRFVSIGEALRDPAYALPDRYAGRAGISWLQRWWITQGHEPRWGPEIADWVNAVAYP